MIVSESDVLVAALDRRLAVDRLLALDPLAATGADAGTKRADQTPPEGLAPHPTAAPSPLVPGSVVAARVVEMPASDQVLVDIGHLRVALAWPGANGPPPTVGGDVALRVVAESPMLMFETLADATPTKVEVDARPRLSTDAMRLQQPSSPGNGPIRFSAPIITLAAATASAGEAAPAASTGLALQGAVAPEKAFDAQPPPPTALPLVLQGPAWPGQDIELVVRRDRADESFDNAALDHWCGEIVIELPHMGRVAGHLAWSMQGLRLRLEGEDDERARSLAAGSAALAAGLAEAGLPVLGLTVARPMTSTSKETRRG